jgi:chemotaxis methyl-accepting protein methylase
MTQHRIDIVSTIDAESTKVDRLIKDIYRNYGYDFCSYNHALVERRTRLFLASKNCEVLSEITPKLLSDK